MSFQITPEILLHAYASGLFPMAETRDTSEVYWVDPEQRGIFPAWSFHISRSLRRQLLRSTYTITTDRAFKEVVEACADRQETWINDTIFGLYDQLHDLGFAHSLEVWDGRSLVGGVYGVALRGAFFGESMFSRRTDASKIALAYLSDRLWRSGYQVFDTQFLTPHLASLGAVEISRARYRDLLAAALETEADFDRFPVQPAPQELLQRSSQTS